MKDVILTSWPSDKQKRPASVAKHRVALGALFAGLLRLEAKDRAAGHGMAPRDFPGAQLGFGRDIFLQQTEALIAAGLLAHTPGWQRLHNFTNYTTGAAETQSGGGMRARFRLTAIGLDRVARAGVELQAWADHWAPRRAEVGLAPSSLALIELRGKKPESGGKGRKLRIDFSDPRVAGWLADLRAHNDFVISAGIEGIAFVGLRRLFSDGDVSGFDWQRHGRFYSLPSGEAYEQLSGEERLRRITLGTECVGEADLRSSQLVLLYALLREPFDGTTDPYAIGDLDRELVKAWVAQALGRGDVKAGRWSGPARQYFEGKHPGASIFKAHQITVYRQQVLARHSVLHRLGGPGVPTILELQFHESEILRAAMASLRLSGIPSLPVHDSLLVPLSRLKDAASAMTNAFATYVEQLIGHPCKVGPVVRLKRSA
ncbi:hypothetical protein [Sphingomonas sp. XXL09]|uniref:hypothetical protein n=1 Tax=Sphingomonas sp. XXL09 TaxID=3457787 RepID=UPI00406BA7ED